MDLKAKERSMNAPGRLPLLALVGALLAALSLSTTADAELVGYVRQTLPTAGAPVALTYDQDGVLYVLSGAGFGVNTATMQVFAADGSLTTSFPVVGDDELSFFVGGMAYDPVGDRLLVTDNTTNGQIYAVGKTGGQTTLATDLPAVAGIVVRSSGEILVSTALGFGDGGVYQIDGTTGDKTEKMLGLDYGAGLTFDGDDLIVQDLNSTTFTGRLQRVAVAADAGGLVFGQPTEMLAEMSSAYGVTLDADGDVFTTGAGGVFNVGGEPAAETLFFNNGRGGSQFATAIAFRGGGAAFEPFAGPLGGVLAVTADGDFGHEDHFVTLFTPALAEDFNADGVVDHLDLAAWRASFGSQTALRQQGDADGNQIVDGADFLRWQVVAEATTLLAGIDALAAGGAGGVRVPEPTTAALSALLALNALIFLGKSARCGNVNEA